MTIAVFHLNGTLIVLERTALSFQNAPLQHILIEK
jgi:hypothetical protein